MNTTILVVDDDAAVGLVIRMILQSEGYDVEAFTSSLEALGRVANESLASPEGIILDLNMPEMDGRQFYHEVRRAGCLCPIVIVSAFDAEKTKRELGAQAALKKPFEPEALLGTLEQLVMR
jgi:CheY-like chemotaxis protein